MRAAAIAELFAPELEGAFGKTPGGQPASLILLLCAQRRVLLCAQQVFWCWIFIPVDLVRWTTTFLQLRKKWKQEQKPNLTQKKSLPDKLTSELLCAQTHFCLKPAFPASWTVLKLHAYLVENLFMYVVSSEAEHFPQQTFWFCPCARKDLFGIKSFLLTAKGCVPVLTTCWWNRSIFASVIA